MATVRVERRFCGPPDSGNGGYVAGLLARALGSSNVAVTLRVPPPLGCELELGNDGTTAWIKDGAVLVAEAERFEVSIDVPAPPTFAAAEEAETRYVGLRHHHFPGCFVCGPERPRGDGLRLFPGVVDSSGGAVASSWTPDPSLLDPDGSVRPEFVWAALDCPGYWSVASAAGLAVLGRFAAVLHADRLAPGQMIVTGWPIASEGRKHRAGTAIHDRDGRLLAAAVAMWVTLRA